MPSLSIPGKDLVTLTYAAEARLQQQCKANSCVRIGVKQGGCAGMEYTMEFVEAPDPGDEILQRSGILLAIAPAATLFLAGTEIDYASGILESGFSFRNPNVTESCGCGESVKFE